MVGLRTRIMTAATVPLVRTLGPALGNIAGTFLQFIAVLALGCMVLILVHFGGAGGIPPHVIKSAAMVLGLIPMGFAGLVMAEQVRLTYSKPKEIVYENVDAFPDREPQ